MNNENQNHTNNQDAIEQDQNSGTPGTPETPQPTPTTDPSAMPAPSDAACQPDLSSEASTKEETSNSEHETSGAELKPMSASTTDSSDRSPATDNRPLTRDELSALNRIQTRGRVSKVSLLPLEIREFINEELLYGTPFFILIRALEEKGYPGFNHSNLHAWQAHGFQTWLKDHQSIAQQAQRRELAFAHAQATGCQLDEALYQLSVENLFQAATQLDPMDLLKNSEDKTELFFKINQGCARLLKVGKGLKKIAPIQGSTRVQPSMTIVGDRTEAKGGLTTEERDAVRRRLGIRPPPPKPQADTSKPEQPATPPGTELSP